MLPRKNRIGYHVFKQYSEKGKGVSSPFFVLRIVTDNDSSEEAQCAVIVSKKIHTQAVRRNALRRRVYRAVHPLIPTIKKGVKLFIFTKKGITNASEEEIRGEINTTLKKVNAIL